MANVVILALIVCGIVWIASIFVHPGGEATDNAQVEQDLVSVNARVNGFVEKIYVDEFSPVRRGDTLLVVESSEYRLHLAQAEAALEAALAGRAVTEKSVSGAKNGMAVTEATIREAEVLLANAEADYQRFKVLYEQEAVTRQQYDQVKTQYESLKARVETLRRQKTGNGIQHDEQSLRVGQQSSAVEAARAAVNLARLQLGYCTVLAPCDGYTSRKLVQQGELVQPGRQLFVIVNGEDRWVVANYRETQLAGIKVGSEVDISVDALDGRKLKGRVQNISTATGAQVSAMPTDNATGNFVKVEQRVPVKIVFTEGNDTALLQRLSAGMNVECLVKAKREE